MDWPEISTTCVSNSYNLIWLNRETKQDLNVWLSFLANYNVRSFFEERWANSQQLNLFTDAAGGIGFGAIFGTEYFHGLWPDEWRYRNIAILEFYPIVLSVWFVFFWLFFFVFFYKLSHK